MLDVVRAAARAASWTPLALAVVSGVVLATSSSACGDLVAATEGDAAPPGEDAGPGVDANAADGESADSGTGREKITCDQSLPYPRYLGCTGLYASWERDQIAPTAKEYKPAFELWADGADKTRWIQLPAGKKIDVSDMNEWKFPVDTKVWKEFRLVIGGKAHKIETRLLWKIGDDQWVRATYRWNEAETNAIELKDGEQGVLGTTYEVPTQSQCTTCHKGRKDVLLGFEAVGLAADGATGLTYEELRRQDLLSSTAKPAKPDLAIPGNAGEVAALGYLHMNCGVSCHSGAPTADATQCRMKLRIDVQPGTQRVPLTVMETEPAKNAVGVGIVYFAPPAGELGSKCRIHPGSFLKSGVHYRASRRDSDPQQRVQMPSIVSHQVDTKGMQTLETWIAGMTVGAGYPAPPDADGGLCPPP